MAIYKQKDFDLRALENIAKKNTAVIVIDMQKDFIKALSPEDAAQLISNQLIVLKHCHNINVPVISFELNHHRYGDIIDVIKNAIRVIPNSCFMEKDYEDCFLRTGLHSYLQSMGIKNVFWMGMYKDICVKYSNESAIKLGYQTMIMPEVIAGEILRYIEEGVEGLYLPG